VKRKTVALALVIDQINTVLADPNSHSQSRRTLLTLAETILHTTNNYQGFRYLSNTELPDTVQPGVRYCTNTGQILDYPQRFENTDPTRVQYALA
jgi:hypothetical protein